MLSDETKTKVDKVISRLCDDFIFVETEKGWGYVSNHLKLLTDLMQAAAVVNGNTSTYVNLSPVINVEKSSDVDQIIKRIEQTLTKEINNTKGATYS